MKQVNVKKLLFLNLPYLLFMWLFDKAAQAVRLSPGAGLSGKLLNLGSGFSQAMESVAPSFHPADLLAGLIGAVVIRLIIYTKGKNAGKAAGKTEQAAGTATKKTAQAGEKGARFIARHWKGALLVLAIGLLILILIGGISSCTNMVIGDLGAVTAISYPSEEHDMKAVEAAYTSMEQDLQYELDNYKSLNPGYDEYRFELDGIHHDPHE